MSLDSLPSFRYFRSFSLLFQPLYDTTLKEESKQNRRAFQKIERAAEKELSRQWIPDRINDVFHFHDSALLSLRKRGRNYEMLLRKDGGWFGEGVIPYIKVIFTDAVLLKREKGLTPRARMEDGTVWSNCVYLYHEMYSVQDGYEVHMLFATRGRSELAYLTVKCRDIYFEDNIQFQTGEVEYPATAYDEENTI